MPGVRLPQGGYRPPEGNLLQLGDHLVSIVDTKQQGVKASGNYSIEIKVGNEEGTLTDYCVITDNTLFHVMQYIAATAPKPSDPKDITEAQWEGWLKGFNYLDAPADVNRLCESLKTRSRPFWVTVISRKDNKGNDRLEIDVMPNRKPIRLATDTEVQMFKPYQSGVDGSAPEEEEGPSL